MTEATADTGAQEPRRVLLTVHTGRRDIVELARTSAVRLMAGGIVVRLLDDEAGALGVQRVPGRRRQAFEVGGVCVVSLHVGVSM